MSTLNKIFRVAGLMGLLAVFAAAPAFAADVFVTGNITTSTTWTADNDYILTEVIYVTDGATLTIEPGTVIRGEPESSPGANDPGTLVVSRGAKIRALGTATDPIVFTDLNDDNVRSNIPTPPYDSAENALALTAQWGGVIMLGRTYVALNTASGPDPSREAQVEGLEGAGALGAYGNCTDQLFGGDPGAVDPQVCDDDDSGVIEYVSIRYGGFNLAADNEINGLTLGAVGRSTDIDYVEVFQNKDDGIEWFGGTVNIANAIVANAGDDSFDYDQGFRGKVQFGFVLQGRPGADRSDKGAEQDGAGSPDESQPYSIPTFYNVTYIGHGGERQDYTNFARNTALHFRDNAGGRYYNSFFGDFGGATVAIEDKPGNDLDSAGRSLSAYPPAAQDSVFYPGPASEFQLELRNNEFWCFGDGDVLPTDAAGYLETTGDDSSGRSAFDPGVFTNPAFANNYQACTAPLPIRALVRQPSGSSEPDQVFEIDPRPAAGSPLLSNVRSYPEDGFFEAVDFRGAFPDGHNWAEGWSTLSRLGYFPPKPQIEINTNITTSTTWTADNEYVLTDVIYVSDGATLTIEPGTVIRGEPESTAGANDPGTLVISRGAKLNALGTPDKPIVLTDLGDTNVGNQAGQIPYDTGSNAQPFTAQWGGLIMLGRTYVALNTASGPDPSREAQVEGLEGAGALGAYGNCTDQLFGGDPGAVDPQVCDDDDSGSVRFLSIRYGGFNLAADNEINGLTLGAVGRGTDMEYVEVFQNKDDGIEWFGGTVNIKNAIVANAGDDSFDYDQGFRGKVQFGLALQGTPGSDLSDKGAEQDGAGSPDESQPYSIPTFANVTYIGHSGDRQDYTNFARNTALHFRDNAGGRYYNSFFGDFGGATVAIEDKPGNDLDSAGRSVSAYPPAAQDSVFYPGPASEFQLELRSNNFWCFGDGDTVPTDSAGYLETTGDDSSGRSAFDPGIFTDPAFDNTYGDCNTPLPISYLERELLVGLPTPPQVVRFDPRPDEASVLLAATRTVADGTFTRTGYRGAFAPTSNWARGWSTLSRLDYFATCDVDGGVLIDPESAQNLAIAQDKTSLTWDKPLSGNFNLTGYDVIRSTAADDFSAATCVETNDGDLEATDETAPTSGSAFFYLVRTLNACGASLGADSSASVRSGAACN